MQGKKLKMLILQWVVPSALLVMLLVGVLLQFREENKKYINSFVKNSIEQTGGTYSRNISAVLESMMGVTNTMDAMLESRGDNNIAYLIQSLDAISDSGAAYSVVYCYPNGNAMGAGHEMVDLSKTDYFHNIQGTESFFAYTVDDGITNQSAILYICPIDYHDRVIGYLVADLNPKVLKEIFDDGKSYGEEVFYAIADEEGNLIASYGGTSKTSFLTDDFWNTIKKDSQVEGSWAPFDLQRKKRQPYSVRVYRNGEERILCQFPIADTEWFLVMGLNQQYADRMLGKVWRPTVALLVKIAVCLVCYLAIIVAINVLMRIRNSEMKMALENKADTDQLTELKNKIATERLIREYIGKYPERQAILFVVDVDNFKKINDTLGHAFGDEVLRNLGMRLQSMFRVTDIIGRIGGDEFIVFLKDVRDDATIAREGKKIEQFFRQFEVGEYVKYSVTASVGGAVFPGDANNFEDLYKAADTAVYTSKKLGKNQLAFYRDREE